MAHHRHAAADQMGHNILMPRQTLKLHRIGAGPDQGTGSGGGDIDALPHGEKRQVGDDKDVGGAPAHGGDMGT